MSKSWKFRLALFCLLHLPIGVSFGLPSAIDQLSNEPVTVFDWGMDQLNKELTELARKLSGNFKAIVNTSQSVNQINLSLYTDERYDEAEARTLADTVFYRVRSDFGVNAATGRPLVGNASNLVIYFNPLGFKRPNRSKIATELDALTQIQVLVPLKGVTSLICRGPLVSKKIACVTED